jgi:hypothetical protein
MRSQGHALVPDAWRCADQSQSGGEAATKRTRTPLSVGNQAFAPIKANREVDDGRSTTEQTQSPIYSTRAPIEANGR